MKIKFSSKINSRHFRHSRHSQLIFLFLLVSVTLQAQKILTLKECYTMAMSNTALAGEKKAYADISALKDANLSKAWLPTLDANGSFIYNSSVVDFKGGIGSIPGIGSMLNTMPHEQYKVTLDINQTIYDGGAIKGSRDLEKAELGINEKQTEADLYKLRSQINSCYFNLLLTARQKELLSNYLEVITKRISSLQSGLSNGVVIRSDIDVLTAEKLKLIQQISENDIRKTSLFKILSDLTGTPIDASAELILPGDTSRLSGELTRPELQLFDLRNEQLSAGLKIIESKRMPKAFGFATVGYGSPPGQNFFKDTFSPYYLVGAGVKWNIFDWNKVNTEKQVVVLQKSIIENRKADMTDNLTRLLESKNAEIVSIEMMIRTDSELIGLRKRITASAESQYENGTITATEYLNELNSERQAMINYEIHKINLSMARIDYMNISGKEIE
jgi:outer membrane protein TolC